MLAYPYPIGHLAEEDGSSAVRQVVICAALQRGAIGYSRLAYGASRILERKRVSVFD